MWTPTDDCEYIEWDGARAQVVTRPVIAETPWVVYLNGRELLTLMCTPTRLHALVLGFLLAEGLITTLEDVWQIKVFLDEDRVYLLFPEAGINEERPLPACAEAVGSIQVWLRREVVLPQRRVLTSGCGGGTTFDDLSAERTPLATTLRVSASQITRLMRELNQNATLYRQSRGVHTSALSDGEQLLLIAEDVGRHNTIDKLRGEALLRGLDTRERILLTSGRISSEMLTKARAMETPIVVSRTSPTATSVRLAQRWNMTLIGYARAPQLRVYAGAERIEFV
ncbi:formate dehydrogenase accessory sulfurtransferase FdhD [Kallotenue papyrolyticum]|uniref:formate dehydrogenase accessory sulfurtransferase FdhD n=1 Tax=Kallotenue papyrolyticum TaxID=1325125 RepID=UPI00046F926C|nr:formate dehydrogenase accessory sulfurtransferase FdhD [Kallotenue papyrolyticum]